MERKLDKYRSSILTLLATFCHYLSRFDPSRCDRPYQILSPSILVPPNSTMRSSKLLILTPWEPSKEFLRSLQEEHPDLKVQHHKLPGWGDPSVPKDLSADDWKDVTVLLTFKIIPPKDLVPNMKYVQLMSAGCNHIMDKDLFLTTDTKFCTANGTHP